MRRLDLDLRWQAPDECDGLPHFTPVGIEKDRIRSQWLNQIEWVLNSFVSQRLLKQDAPPHPPTPSPLEEEKGS